MYAVNLYSLVAKCLSLFGTKFFNEHGMNCMQTADNLIKWRWQQFLVPTLVQQLQLSV